MGDDDGFVIRLRGLPWSATEQEVVQFFGDEIEIVDGEDGVHFTYSREGRPSGEAFLELTSEEDMEKALKKHNEHMGNRYIEVFRSKKSEMEWVIKRAGPNQTTGTSEAVVRLRGLPFGCSKEEIAQFFTGLEIVPNGIMLPEDRQGRSTGEAYVQFATQAIAEEALNKHKERIGHRYIEIFKSSLQEAYSAMGIGMGGGMGQMRPRPLMGIVRPSPYDRSERFGGMGGMSSMGSGGMGMGSYGRGRGGRNVKGFYDDDFDDYSGGYSGGGMGMSSGMSMGGMSMGMNRRGNMRQQRVMGSRMGMGMGSGMGGSGMSMGGMSTSNRDRGAVPGSHYVSKTGHSVHMRGLPFQALESDIAEFFSPLVPVKVEFEFSPNGRPTGEANVDFSTHQEAVEAMKKHKSNMQHRYIELFLNSTPAGRGDSFGSGSSMGGGGGFGGDMRDNFNNFSNGDGYNDLGGMESYGGKSKLGGYGGMSGGGMGSNMGGGMGGSMGGGMGGMGSNYTAF